MLAPLPPLLFFTLTLLFGLPHSLICSKSPPIHHKSTLTRDRVTGQLSEQTLVTISIGLKETACFSLENSKYWHKNEVYGISLDDVKSVLQYKNSYTFGIPDIDVKCICDCPGVEDFCNSNTNSCQENGYFGLGTCYNWYRQGMSNSGCTAFLSGSAEVCCSIIVEPRNRTVWRAIELGRSSNRAVFTVTSLNTQTTKTTEVDIEGGHPVLDPFYLTVSAPAINTPLKSGWYFGSDNRDTLFGGVVLNSLSEYDTNKLGWYKYTRGEFEMDKSEIMDSFSIEVKNCDKDELNVEFDNKNTLKTFEQATELNQLYKTSLSRVLRLDDERRVEAFFRQYSNIELTLTLQGDYNVVQVFDVSHFKDFDGEVMMDKHSNYFVNITIYEGQGSIRGNLTVGVVPETDVFKINIPQHQTMLSVFYIRLSSLCEADQSARLCLWTEVGVDSVMCKNVICDREPLQEFELPDSVIEYEKGEKMSILSPATWAKHLNPAEWFNGITNWKEAVIMATELVGILTIIGIVLKVLKIFGCLGKCWSCICGPLNFDWCTKKKIKPKTSSSVDREHKQLLQDDQIVLSDGSTVTWNQSFRNRSHSSESSPSWKVSTPRYIELDDINGNPVLFQTSGPGSDDTPTLFVYDTKSAGVSNSSGSYSNTPPRSMSSTPPVPPVPPRVPTPAINLTPVAGRKSSTLPNSLSGALPSRIPVPLANRFGRRNTIQHVTLPKNGSPVLKRKGVGSPVLGRVQGQGSTPNLAKVLLGRPNLNEQELEMVYNSTESLISRGDSFRVGHSRNNSRVLLLKSSSDF